MPHQRGHDLHRPAAGTTHPRGVADEPLGRLVFEIAAGVAVVRRPGIVGEHRIERLGRLPGPPHCQEHLRFLLQQSRLLAGLHPRGVFEGFKRLRVAPLGSQDRPF